MKRLSVTYAEAKTLNDQAGSGSFMTLKVTSFEVIDTIVVQMESQLEDFEKFHFVELLDEKNNL